MLGIIVGVVGIYVVCGALVVSYINDIPPIDRKLTKFRWVRIAMALGAPAVLAGGIVACAVMGVVALISSSYTGLRVLITGKTPPSRANSHKSSYDYNYDEEEESEYY